MQKKPENKTAQAGYRLVVAGGGTGGHLFPGIAVAQAFCSRHPDNQVLFVNAGRPLETQVLSRSGWPHRIIAIEGIKGRGRWRQAVAACKIPGAIWHAGRIISRFRADLVLGVGGYSAGPVVTAARIKGIPTALHEQNRLPGVTNRMLGRMVDRVYLTFAESRNHFDADKVRITGNPVRDEIISLAGRDRAVDDEKIFTVLVVGGSQGAQAINRAVVEALTELKGLAGLRLVHQTGPQDEEQIRRAYAQSGIRATVQAFFDDMAEQYARSDLVICRAGATTIAEITVAGKAAVFIPFPFAADDHQTQNALALADVGAAKMIAQKDLSGSLLAQTIVHYMDNRSVVAGMADKARALGRPEAAQVIADDIYQVIQNRSARSRL